MITEADLKGGEAFLQSAKKMHADKRKSAHDDLNAVCLDGAKYAWSKPVTTSGKDIQIIRRHASKCCVCQSFGGNIYLENGRKFCQEHKHMMRWPENELHQAIEKERLKC